MCLIIISRMLCSDCDYFECVKWFPVFASKILVMTPVVINDSQSLFVFRSNSSVAVRCMGHINPTTFSVA